MARATGGDPSRSDVPGRSEPWPMDLCAHCGRRCRVPVTRQMPDRVRLAYEAARWASMATCEEGAAEEHRLLGASYADVIAERMDRIVASAKEQAIAVTRGIRAAAVQARNESIAMRARNDQCAARIRDLAEELSHREARGQGPDGEL